MALMLVARASILCPLMNFCNFTSFFTLHLYVTSLFIHSTFHYYLAHMCFHIYICNILLFLHQGAAYMWRLRGHGHLNAIDCIALNRGKVVDIKLT